MDYKSAGVDIEAGDAWVDVIKRAVSERGESLPKSGGIGGFAGTFPVGGGRSIVACCDGVGTKLILADQTGLYRGLGQDLVAMSVNDLVTCGATPLFFLDYIACERLEIEQMKEILNGILDACVESSCALLGGETAELPGVYPKDGFDLAGFAVGIVDDDKIVTGRDIAPGDRIIGIASSGVHSNGYSLVRRAVEDKDLSSRPGELMGASIGEALMTPTRIYVPQAMAATAKHRIKGMAHITGGGLESNILRLVPKELTISINYGSWPRNAIFDLIQEVGIEEEEMRRVFNLGIGYVFIASPEESEGLSETLRQLGENPAEIGEVVKGERR